MKEKLVLWASVIAILLPTVPCQARVSDAEANLVRDIARDGMLEVNLAKIAINNGKSKKVKDFAQHMISDHSAANDELKTAAQKDNLELPTDLTNEQKKKEDFLRAINGQTFDKKYVAEMVTAHKKAVDAIAEEANTGTGNLKAWAKKTLPTIRDHKKEANSIDSKLAQSSVFNQ